MTPLSALDVQSAQTATSIAAGRPSLEPLLNAHSVAIVGISQSDRFGGKVYLNLRDFGYAGQIYGVNPRYDTLYDQPCYSSLTALPQRPDLAVLAVPNDRLLTAVQEAAQCHIPAIFIPGNAHSEDNQLSQRIAEIARVNNIVVCGPNCMGFHAFGQRLVVSGYVLDPAVQAGNVAFITHSGSVFDALWQNTRGLRFNYLISSGNELTTTAADYLQFVLNDPATYAVGLFIETVRDPQQFVVALELAAERDIPIAVLKVGRTERGAQLALAHSGALAGRDAAFDALCRHYGVQRVRSLDEMLDTLELFAARLRPPTQHIASIHDSGGERGLLMDLAELEGVTFAPLGADTVAKLSALLDPGLAPINPLDAWGTGNDYHRIYRDCLIALDAEPTNGLTAFAVDLYPSDESAYVDIALEAKPSVTKPFIFLTNLASSVDSAQANQLRANGIPVLTGTETGVRAIKHLLDYCQWQRNKGSNTTTLERSAGAIDVSQFLIGSPNEFVSGEVLQAYGIPVAERLVAQSIDEVLQAGETIGYPIVLKTAEAIAHKTEVKGVHLNLRNANELALAYRDLKNRLGGRVLVQKMVTDGIELLLGLSKDEQFGWMLVIGLGGVFVESFHESRLVLLPCTPDEILTTLLSLRGAELLNGWRNQPPVNIEAVIEAALCLAQLAADWGDQIAAVDINPLIASANGVLAADALVILKQ